MQALHVIQHEHRNMWRIAITLDRVAAEYANGIDTDRRFFVAAFDYLEQFVDRLHHPKEDDHLFARLRGRSGEADRLIGALEVEHREAPGQLRRLRLALDDGGGAGEAKSRRAFQAALTTYTDTLRDHIRREEKALLPLARTLLADSDWAAIDAAFLDHRDPLFGDQVAADFRELYHRLVALAPDSMGLGGERGGSLQSGDDNEGDLLLEVCGLQSDYGRIRALKGLDLNVRKGETVALVGANGAGKTTLLRCLSGVQPVTGGSLRYHAKDITRASAHQRTRLGIAQSPEGRQVFGPLSIEDNLRLGAYTRKRWESDEDLARIYRMFPILEEKRLLPAGTLSGGQQQMLAIGRALMARPQLLLLDEPSMGLAPLLVEEVFNVIKTLKAAGMSIILAEQNAFAALAIADQAYVLETGTITLSGPGQALIDDERVRSAYLGM